MLKTLCICYKKGISMPRRLGLQLFWSGQMRLQVILASVLAGRHVVIALKYPDKGFRIFIAQTVAYFRHTKLSGEQKTFSVLKTYGC